MPFQQTAASGLAATQQQYLDWMRDEVQKPDFLENNFLSTEERIPVDVVQTNAARALATNAIRGHVWDNFSSETYKTLPSAGDIEVQDPFDNSTQKFHAPGGGPGYYRVPSLIGIWATAPFLHNNALGIYTGDPSVAGRMKAFDDAAEKLLWPEKRLGLASIARTTAESYIQIPASYLPAELQTLTRRRLPAHRSDSCRYADRSDCQCRSGSVGSGQGSRPRQTHRQGASRSLQIKLKHLDSNAAQAVLSESRSRPAEDQQVSGLRARSRPLLRDTAAR